MAPCGHVHGCGPDWQLSAVHAVLRSVAFEFRLVVELALSRLRRGVGIDGAMMLIRLLAAAEQPPHTFLVTAIIRMSYCETGRHRDSSTT